MLPLERRRTVRPTGSVASAVAMLGSADAYFITGTELRIDGGTHMSTAVSGSIRR